MRLRPGIIIWGIIILGIGLRLTDITIPDITTDEVQAALGTSPAWTPLGMMILRAAQAIFGHEIIVVRSVSFLFGVAFLPLIYRLSLLYCNRKTALLAAAIAAIFPAHILFSRLSYLSVQLCFAWTLVLYFFLRARKESSTKWIIALYLSSIAATMIKTQGLLFPVFLITGLIAENLIRKNRFFRSSHSKQANKQMSAPAKTLILALVASLIPVGFYILSHPGIFATVFQYGGNMYGISGSGNRVVSLITTWWHSLYIFLIAMLFGLMAFKKLDWPFWTLIGTGILTGFVLGPSHEYYATYMVLFALPIGIVLMLLKPIQRIISVLILAATTLAMFAPVSLVQTKWMSAHYRTNAYWNTHADAMNKVLDGQEKITILGGPGHHVRWYLNPLVLVGDNMEKPYKTEYILVLRNPDLAKRLGEVVYEDERTTIVKTE